MSSIAARFHKRQNILGHLPGRLVESVKAVLKEAWGLGDADVAKRRLERLASSLEADHPGAAASVREGLDETLTLQRLGIGGTSVREAPQYECDRESEQRDRNVLKEREALEGRVDGRSLGSAQRSSKRRRSSAAFRGGATSRSLCQSSMTSKPRKRRLQSASPKINHRAAAQRRSTASGAIPRFASSGQNQRQRFMPVRITFTGLWCSSSSRTKSLGYGCWTFSVSHHSAKTGSFSQPLVQLARGSHTPSSRIPFVCSLY